MFYRSFMHMFILVTLLAPFSMPVRPAAAQPAAPFGAQAETPAAASNRRDRTTFAMTFMPNQGQLDPAIAFQAPSLGGALDFTASGVTFTLPPATPPETPRTRMLRRSSRPPLPPQTFTLQYTGANVAPTIAPLGDSAGTVSVQVGDPNTWRTDLPTYPSIGYQQLYAGIDLAYTSAEGRLKSTYTVAPGANPSVIGWQYNGTDAVAVDAATGDLHITLPAQVDGTTPLTPTTLVERAPLAWQERDGTQTAVAVAYRMDADGTVGFALGSFDATLPLLIDPEVTYLTRDLSFAGYGGNVAVAADGTTYVVTSPVRSGTYGDLYVQAFSPEGELLTAPRYFGGSDFDSDSAITVGADGAVYIVGNTRSADFSPSTANRLQGFVGAADPYYPTFVREDAFLIRLDPATLAPTYGTFLGGTREDSATGVAVRPDGTIVLVGTTYSSSFAATSVAGLPYEGDRDAFMLLLAPSGDGYTVAASHALGDARNDDATDVAFDAQGTIFMSGLLNHTGGGDGDDSPFTGGYGFLARYNAAGVFQNLHVWGESAAPGKDAITSADALAVTPDGHVFVVSNSSTYDGEEGTSTYGAELHGWDADDNATSVSILSTNYYQYGSDIVADSNGNLYVALGGDPATVLLFLAGQDTSSTAVPFAPGSLQLAVDSTNDVYVLGDAYDESGYLAKIAGIPGPVQLTITDADGQPVTALKLNDDGWPVLNSDTDTVANPVTVRVTVRKPSSDVTALALTFGSSENVARFYPGVDPEQTGCATQETLPENTENTFSYRRFDVACDLRTIPTGTTQTWSWRVQVQPSEEGTLDVRAGLLSSDSPETPLVAAVQAQVQVPSAPMANIRPVIFIPGISGSFLDDTALGFNFWPGSALIDYGRLSLYEDDLNSFFVRPNIVATDAIRTAAGSTVYGSLLNHLQQLGYTEYQVGSDPSRRAASCSTDQLENQPKLFVFAYDWRQDNADTAEKLHEYVQCIRAYYPDTQVDIVAHSMGGLVTRRYILDHPGVVHTAVTIATPYLGAPKALNTLETGEFIGWLNHRALISENELRNIAGSFSGASQLTPSQAYYELLTPGDAKVPLPLGEAGWDWNNNGNPNEEYTYDEQVRVLDSRYGRGIFPVGSISQEFHDHSSPSGEQDDWRIDSTGVRYYVIYGQTDGDTTITKVRAADDLATCRSDVAPSWGKCFFGKYTSLGFGPGDGTVPTLSALRKGNGKNYAPNLAEEAYQANGGDQTHTGLPDNKDVQQQVGRYLTGLPAEAASDGSSAFNGRTMTQMFFSVAHTPLATSATGTQQVQSPPKAKYIAASTNRANQTTRPSYYLTIHNIATATLVVSDSHGNSTASSDGFISGEVPGVDVYTIGSRSRTLVVGTTDTYTVTFQAPAEPIGLELRLGTGDTTNRAVIYRDLNLPTGATVQLVLTPQAPDQMRYDQDGDGLFESTVVPTADVNGTLAQDREGPIISAATTPLASGQVQVMLLAQDASSIQALRYSLDGATFQPYTGTLTVDPVQTTVVYAFADDVAGNRSNLFQQPIPKPAQPTATPASTPTVMPTSAPTATPTSTPTTVPTSTPSPTSITQPTSTATPTTVPTSTPSPTSTPVAASSADVIARHALTINGNARIDGSAQQLLGEALTMNGNARIRDDLRLPGSPRIVQNRASAIGTTATGDGSAQPDGYRLTLNGGVRIGRLVTRTDAVTLPTVAVPAPPLGTRDVTINQAGQPLGDPATLRHLTLNGNAGTVNLPPGRYGRATLNGSNTLVLGVAGSLQPAQYSFQTLNLNGSSQINVVGPVQITLVTGGAWNSTLGEVSHPDWLTLRVAGGSVTLNGSAALYGTLIAPDSTVTLNGNATLVGTLRADQLTLNGGSAVQDIAAGRNSTPARGPR